MAKHDEPTLYEPDEIPDALVREVDADLDARLTGKETVEVIANALKDAAFELAEDDTITIATAESLTITDADAYARGYELLSELGALETRISTHYARFDKPLNYLISVVRKLKGPQVHQVTPIKQALSKRLGQWKWEQDRLAEQRREAEQRAADMAAKAAQAAKAAALERVAQAELDPALAASFRNEAESVRAVEVHAPPVETRSTVPSITGGYSRTQWKCEFTDLKALLAAYVEGKCYLDEAAIIKGLQSSMDKQAQSLTVNLEKAYPGTKGVPVPSGVARRAK